MAVEQIEGPVLVIAGPGTGKTHILAARIGNILLKTDTSANSILCLTFSDAGVQAMRQRLLQFIGAEAHRVNIYTFHSFSNRVIQENLEYFGNLGLEPVSDLERIELIRTMLARLRVSHPLRIGKSSPFYYEKHLQHLFRIMKLEQWEVEDMQAKIDHFLSEIPHREDFIYQVNWGRFKKGQIKKAKVEDAQRKMELLRAACELFEEYQHLMQKAQRYDYEDMIRWVIDAFQEHEVLLRKYQERYLYFLIDEFQDTNGAQNTLVQQLVNYWDNPNLFIVGDDDQSIYEFQGARIKNITDFYQKYQNYLKVIVLEDNYRSTQPILDHAGQLIIHNKNRVVAKLADLAIQKKLSAQNPTVKKINEKPVIRVYENPFQEEAALVEEINQLAQKNFPLAEIAIIYTRHRQAENIIELFQRQKIPFNTRRNVNILSLPIIQQLRQMIEFVALELDRPGKGEHLVYRMLHFQFFQIRRSDIENIHWSISKEAERIPWREAINRKDYLNALSSRDQIELLSTLLEKWIGFGANHSTVSLVENMINTSGILRFAIEQEERQFLVEVLHAFLSFVKQENDRNSRLRPAGLIEVIRKLEENRLGIPLNEVVKQENGVNLLTAHSAKGLEFRYVYLIHATKEHWEPRGRSGSFQFSLPDTLTFSNESDQFEARRRLFYVAMTRAKEQLVISYSQSSLQGKPVERCVFIDELMSPNSIGIEEHAVTETSLHEKQKLLLTETAKSNRIEPMDKDWITDQLTNFSLSTTALDTYLKCPLGFFYEYVLKAPVLSSEAASYGTAVHNALQRLFERMLMDPGKHFPGQSSLISFFEQEMDSLRSHFSFQSWERYLEQGRYSLTGFYRSKHHSWHKKVAVEYSIREAEIEGVPIKGTIDKLEYLKDNKVRIVDYKTGSHDPGKLRSPTRMRPYGGSYWRQLVFYKVLFEQYNKAFQQVESATVVYVQPNASGKFVEKTISPEPDQVKLIIELIRETYERILNHDFYQGCGKKDCKWCSFMKNNDLYENFAREDTLMDDKFF